MSAVRLNTPQQIDYMAAVRTLNRMRRAGFTLTIDIENLVVTPASTLTDEQRAYIRAHKATLVQLLTDTETVYNALQGASTAGIGWHEGTPQDWPESRLLAADEVLYADGRMVNRQGRRYATEHAPPSIPITEYVIPADTPHSRTDPHKAAQSADVCGLGMETDRPGQTGQPDNWEVSP